MGIRVSSRFPSDADARTTLGEIPIQAYGGQREVMSFMFKLAHQGCIDHWPCSGHPLQVMQCARTSVMRKMGFEITELGIKSRVFHPLTVNSQSNPSPCWQNENSPTCLIGLLRSFKSKRKKV